MLNKDPLLSIVIVNYNTGEYLSNCLTSIYANDCPFDFEVIVVDNNSDNGDMRMLRERFPQTKTIINQENYGYAIGNNQAIKNSASPYILLLNPDTILSKDSLYKLVNFLENHPDAGIVGPKLVKADGKLDLACHRSFPTPLSSFFKISGISRLLPKISFFSEYNLTYRDSNQTMEIDSPTGACMLIRRNALKTAGLFDENFFLYGEDLDLAYRIKQCGWRVFYCPEVSVKHFKRASTSQNQKMATREFYKAMEIFYNKHYRERYAASLRWVIFIATKTICWVQLLFAESHSSYNTFHHIFCSILDTCISIFLFILFFPVMIAIGVLIKLDSPGPILYIQERIGYKAKRFKMIKFRTMVDNAEGKTGPVLAVQNDPRQTKMGSFLRRYCLDELPQLMNIMKGEMNIIGPRPERPFFVDAVKNELPNYLERFNIKCGITGWAQVNGLRGNSLFEERLKYDLEYLQKWSILFDFKILFLTLPIILNGNIKPPK